MMSKQNILLGYRELAEKKEFETLHSKASYSKDHSRRDGPEDDHRLPYKRDVDRILHSKAYSRYVDKTQVVYLVRNDHVTHRSLHVQLVSNFARGMAEILGLNLDLVEAIALGHDVGHPPFGHEGEGYLDALSQEFGGGPFAHPIQSCRLFSKIEPLNLGLAVYDGFLCHDGGMGGNRLVPNFGKSFEDHDEEIVNKKKNPDGNIMPGTLEGCLVKIADTMSYLGKDLEDAISLGILQRSDVPKTILGQCNREMLSHLAQDVIENSFGKDYIELSEESFAALKEIRRFNFEMIYQHPKLKVESEKIAESYRVLFVRLLQEYKKKGTSSYLHKRFLCNKSKQYLDESTDVQKVIDYIAGMTDNYFVKTLEDIFVPTRIVLGV